MNKIYTHPGQPQMQVEVILASRGANGAPPIYTIRLRYPRIIHGEIMTHRVFSRNARSSRAVPVKTMLDEVRNTPFIPWHWGKNQKGMQAGEDCNEQVVLNPEDVVTFDGRVIGFTRENAWHYARDTTADIAEAYMEAGYHKQIPNRLLEPFSWIDTLITATDWANFLHLRDHKDAEPHLQDLARLVKQAIEEAHVQELDEGYWHLPYITEEDWMKAKAADSNWLCQISAARCARISYKPFDGDASYERELERYNQLVTSERVHASPLEHQAQVDSTSIKDAYGEPMSADELRENSWLEVPHLPTFDTPHLSGNFAPGWIQFRKTVPGECFTG